MEYVKTCSNCAYLRGSVAHGKCVGSGHYASVERQFPEWCGRDYERWKPSEALTEKIAAHAKAEEKAKLKAEKGETTNWWKVTAITLMILIALFSANCSITTSTL